MANFYKLGLLLAQLVFVFGEGEVFKGCLECDLDLCPPVKNCPAGLDKDRCACCDVCANSEGEKCDLEGEDYKFGDCGRNLVCKLRTDVAGGVRSSTCHCKRPGPVCGDNGVTYDNYCQMKAEGERIGKNIEEKYLRPCKAVPSIRSPPSNIKNMTGSNVFLSCEAAGYPIPTMTWTWRNNAQEEISLPTDDLHVSVNSRGGPEKYMVSAWVQIMDLQEHHQGDYTCKANNEIGMAAETARVNVVDPSRL